MAQDQPRNTRLIRPGFAGFRRPEEEAPATPQPPSTGRRIAGGAIRLAGSVPASWLSVVPGPGNLLAGGIGAATELAAQTVEEQGENESLLSSFKRQFDAESLKRAAIEGVISGVPIAPLLAGKKVLPTMLKMGAFTGGGEAARQLVRGEDLDLGSIATATGIGAATGGILGKAMPAYKKPVPVPQPTMAELLQKYPDPEAFEKAVTDLVKRDRWTVPKLAKEATRMGETDPERAVALRKAAIRSGIWTPKVLQTQIDRLVGQGLHEEAQALRRAALDLDLPIDRFTPKMAKDAAAYSKAEESRRLAQTATENLRKKGKVSPRAIQSVAGEDPLTGEKVIFQEIISPKKTGKAGGKVARVVDEDAPTGALPATGTPDESFSTQPDFFQVINKTTGKVLWETTDYKAALDRVGKSSMLAVKPILRNVPESLPAKPAQAVPETPASPAPSGTVAQAGSVISKFATPAIERAVKAGKPLTAKQAAQQHGYEELLARLQSESAITPTAPAAPIVDVPPAQPGPAVAPATTPPPAPVVSTAVSPGPDNLKSDLLRLGYSSADIAGMTQQQRDRIVQTGLQKATQTALNPQTTPVPTAPVQQAAPSAPPAAPATGKPAKAPKVPNVLTGDERANIAEGVLRNSLPKEIVNEAVTLSRAYNLAGAAAESGDEVAKASWIEAGAALKAFFMRAEAQGAIPKGWSQELTKELRVAMSRANESKLAQVGPPPVRGAAPIVDTPPAASIASDSLDPERKARLSDLIRRREEAAQNLNTPPEVHAALDKEWEDFRREVRKVVASKEPRPRRGPGDETGAFMVEPQMHIASAALGALGGAVLDPLDDPVMSTLVGLAGGAVAPSMIRVAKNLLQHDTDLAAEAAGQEKSLVSTITHLAPHIQRFNYLTSFGLPANMWFGPYGAAFFGSLTKFLAGDPRGLAALRQMGFINWGKEYSRAFTEAKELIARADMGDTLLRAEIHGQSLASLHPHAATLIQGPAIYMAAGDVASRNILKNAGFSEEEARAMTLTAEPFLASMKKLVRMGKGEPSPFIDLLFPFKRTPANIFEQGMLRMPGAGFRVNQNRVRGGADDIGTREQLVQQAVAGLVGYTSYLVGQGMDPESARHLRRYLTNAAGPYSLQASIGFALGQTNQRTGGGFMEALGNPGLLAREIEFSVPLPTIQPVQEAARAAGQVIQRVAGTSSDPVQLPAGAYPAIFRDAGVADDLGIAPAPRIAPSFNLNLPASSRFRRNF